MEPWLEQFQKTRHEVVLSSEKKEAVRALLKLKMMLTPTPAPAAPWQHVFLRPAVLTAATFGLLVFAGGTLSAVAEQTIPGDALYPVKVKFNEEVRSALALTPEAKADWAVQRATRRLDEADVLAERDGSVASTTKHELTQTFAVQAAAANAAIGAVEKKNPKTAFGLADRFEKVLRKPRRRTTSSPAAFSKSAPSPVVETSSLSSTAPANAPAPTAWPVTIASDTEKTSSQPLRHPVPPIPMPWQPRSTNVPEEVEVGGGENNTATSESAEAADLTNEQSAPPAGLGVTAHVPDESEAEFDNAVQKTLNDVQQTRERLWSHGPWDGYNGD